MVVQSGIQETAMRIVAIFAAVLALSVPALAQTQRLPRTSPSEREVLELNRSMQGQNRSLNNQQQNQFENNQLRQELNRQQVFPPPGSLGRICRPGQVC
jgi:predicted PurR-regulated permease PerM